LDTAWFAYLYSDSLFGCGLDYVLGCDYNVSGFLGGMMHSWIDKCYAFEPDLFDCMPSTMLSVIISVAKKNGRDAKEAVEYTLGKYIPHIHPESLAKTLGEI
jgi:hypothetical protein